MKQALLFILALLLLGGCVPRRSHDAQYYQRQDAYRRQMAANQQARQIGYQKIQEGSYLRVTGASVLNIRSGPGTSYSVIGMLRGGESIRVVRFNKGWAEIESDDGYLKGWVSGRYLRSDNR